MVLYVGNKNQWNNGWPMVLLCFPPLGCCFAVATFDIIFVGLLFEKFSIFLLYFTFFLPLPFVKRKFTY